MQIQREISERIRRAAEASPAVVLTGVRQTGKTTQAEEGPHLLR